MTEQEYYQRLQKFRIPETEGSSAVIDSLLPFLERLDKVDSSSVALFDMTGLQYKYLPDQLKLLPQLDSEEAKETGMSFFFKLINDEDLPFVFETCIESYDYIWSQPASNRKDFKTCFDFRISSDEIPPLRIIQQITVLELDSEGRPWLILIVNDISPLHDQDVPGRRYMERLSDGRRVLFPDDEAEVKSPISARELEVLGLIAQGYGSREVADYLSISVNTVNNHRQNILRRLNAASTAEAIQTAGRLKLL